jgi:23S rRNA (uracil1939-C5)-methyltransferase
VNQRTYPVKKREELKLRVDKLAFGGKGISRIDDYVIFVDKTLPGDLVRARIYKRKSNYAQARVIELIESSPLRQEAPCPYFGWCGGCTWQNLSYDEQLKVKRDHVSDGLRQIAGLPDVIVEETLPSHQIWGYRNKMEFSFSDRRWLLPHEMDEFNPKIDFALGLHIPGTFDKILDIENCLLQNESANNVLKIVSEYAVREGLQPYGIHSQEGFLRFLVIRQSIYNNHLMVNIVTSTKQPKLLQGLVEEITKGVPEVSSIINTINSKKAQVAFGEEEIVLAGKSYIQDKIGDFIFNISANSFFQTNTAQAERLYNTVLAYSNLKGDEIVWDFYAGTGTISLFLAQKSGFVYAFELVESAVRDGIENARIHHVENIKFIQGDLLENVNLIEQQAEVVVVDPPRSGIHPKVCLYLAKCGADRIVYVSCNPTTMARDIEILAQNYKVEKIQPVDMFPHTYHIESVCLLLKRS